PVFYRLFPSLLTATPYRWFLYREWDLFFHLHGQYCRYQNNATREEWHLFHEYLPRTDFPVLRLYSRLLPNLQYLQSLRFLVARLHAVLVLPVFPIWDQERLRSRY